MDCREIDFKNKIQKKEMKAISTWFFTDGACGGDVSVRGSIAA